MSRSTRQQRRQRWAREHPVRSAVLTAIFAGTVYFELSLVWNLDSGGVVSKLVNAVIYAALFAIAMYYVRRYMLNRQRETALCAGETRRGRFRFKGSSTSGEPDVTAESPDMAPHRIRI